MFCVWLRFAKKKNLVCPKLDVLLCFVVLCKEKKPSVVS